MNNKKKKTEVFFDEEVDPKEIIQDKKNKKTIKRLNEMNRRSSDKTAKKLLLKGINLKDLIPYMKKNYKESVKLNKISYNYNFMPMFMPLNEDNYYIKEIASNLYEFGRYNIKRYGQTSTIEKALKQVIKIQNADNYFTEIAYLRKNKKPLVIVH